LHAAFADWRRWAAQRRAFRVRLGIFLSRHATSLLEGSMRHWRHAVLTSHRDAAATNVERLWTRQSGLASSFAAWLRWLDVRVARRERDAALAATLQHAAARVTCMRAPLADANARGGHSCSLQAWCGALQLRAGMLSQL
jgi:hypothetical protein